MTLYCSPQFSVGLALTAKSSTARSTPFDPAQTLEQGIVELGLTLPENAVAQLLRYLAELYKWNQAYNLTAIRDPREMVVRHVLDALAVLPHIGAGPLLDVGSGAGLPGIVLAIARPQLSVTVLDSNGKKTRFMRHAVRTLSLSNVEVSESRAEALSVTQLYAIIISRAFAVLPEFIALTSHLLAPDGQWLAMKGKLIEQERQDLPSGVAVVDVIPLKVPGLPEARHLIVMTRTR